MKEPKEILSINSLYLGYKDDDFLLEDLNAVVKEGELVVLVGSNGVGKSTLLKTLTRMRMPSEGEIFLNNREFKTYTAREFAHQVSFVGAASLLLENLSVFELVSMGRHPYTNWWGKLSQKDEALVEEAIGFVDMMKFRDVKVTRLSDGERQRVMIARALAQHTPLMIFDEPTAFLDIPNKMSIVEVLSKLTKLGHSVILSTHDFDTAFQYADKMWVLNDNQLIEGAPEDLALNGELDDLFKNNELEFDHDNLRYHSKCSYKKSISCKIEDDTLQIWLRRALHRKGIELTTSQSKHYIHYDMDAKCPWIICQNEDSVAFQTLYELTNYLTNHE